MSKYPFELNTPRIATIVFLLLGLGACSPEARPERTREQLFEARAKADQANQEAAKALLARFLARAKVQYDDYAAGRRAQPPTVDLLVISGGGDWGAFGAGFLKGWRNIQADSALAKPDFAAVTGVSTGALIAPFAFLNTDEATSRIADLYRNPKSDWVQWRGSLYFLPSHISLAEVPGLERELRTYVTDDLIRKIAARGADGRVLAVNTTDVDNGGPRVFDLVDEAARANKTGNYERFRQIMLASAGIPGVFPARIIDDVMYVDGGATGNIIFGGRLDEQDSFPAMWKKAYPDLKMPTVRYWVIFNNQLRPQPQVTKASWVAVVQRSMETGTRASTTTAMRQLFGMAEVARLKQNADVQVRVVSIPDGWAPPNPGSFDKQTMNNLADLGERMGADPASWKTDIP